MNEDIVALTGLGFSAERANKVEDKTGDNDEEDDADDMGYDDYEEGGDRDEEDYWVKRL